jgi:hypothetical protein
LIFQNSNFSINLLENLQLGGAFTIGNRVNKEEKTGKAQRFQFIAKLLLTPTFQA